MKLLLNSLGARFRPLQRILALVFLLAVTLFPPSLSAQNSTNHPNLRNRWLFIVDTSRAQKKRAESVREIAGGLLMSGVSGQMRDGDTVGLWTYNDSLHTGELPLQEWTSDTSRKITQHVYDFLEQQTFENDGDLAKVMPELARLVKNSDFITVILISDGSHEISGTPFDAQINESYKSWRKELSDDEKMIVTLLRANHGKITDYRVNMPPWPFDMPPLPAELLVERTPAKVNKAAPAPPPVYQPSLILSGKKPQPTATQMAQGGTAVPQPGTNAVAPTQANPTADNSVPHRPGQSLGGITAQARTTTQPTKTALAAPTQTAVALPSQTPFGHKILWLAAAGLVAIVFCVWIALRARQSRSGVRISLVPRSLDRDQE